MGPKYSGHLPPFWALNTLLYATDSFVDPPLRKRGVPIDLIFLLYGVILCERR
jgi:hypothetical protein